MLGTRSLCCFVHLLLTLHPITLQAEYTYTLPYTSQFLDKQLHYPVKLWVNDDTVMRRIDIYDGLDGELDRDVRAAHTDTCFLNGSQTDICIRARKRVVP